MFTLTIETDNDAFGNSHRSRNREIARILKDVANRTLPDSTYDTDGLFVYDVNGNKVGEWKVTP